MSEPDFDDQVARAIDDLKLEDMFWTAKGVEGAELARAVLVVLGRRHGNAFLDEVGEELARRRDELAKKPMREEVELAHALDHSDLWTDLQEIAELIERPTSLPPAGV